MNDIECWLNQLKSDYVLDIRNEISTLSRAVSHAPASIFGPIDTELQSEAIAYWFDSCQRLSYYYQHLNDVELAYSYMHFAYSKLQELASLSPQNPAMKRWCYKKLDRMIVSMMEFCQQQHGQRWEQESNDLVELHVIFMQGQQHINLVYELSPPYTS
ncbi:hypothetical protein [Photobacterium nomapromontoriensis]|uniref:hypothetical protein n=1 Tax=Photobacterium nomapromontoriensis TaxID=2910237 RepID=UPI003D13E6EB